jgi:hypothetical protein
MVRLDMYVNDENRAMVLACLYNNAMSQGMGLLHYKPGDMTLEEAEKILKDCPDGRFDYLFGRVMKVNLGRKGTSALVDFRLYDRDNGEGRGAEVTRGLEV